MQFIDEVLAEWEKDCKITRTGLFDENIKTPILTAKYMKKRVEAVAAYRRVKGRENAVIKDLSDYYRGKLNRKEELARLKRPMQQEAVTAAALPGVLDLDPEVLKYRDETSEWKEAVDLIDAILKEISSRGYTINAAIKLIKMETGAL
jgi:hypothetical protein